MVVIQKYSSVNKEEWNSFIQNSRNGTFLFTRDYLDYHSARYKDCSFVFRKNSKLISVIAGTIENHVYYSHIGLTYGGFICATEVTAVEIYSFFQDLNKELSILGVKEVVYKPIPFIYHKNPSQDDVYFLFKMGAKIIACNISSVIIQSSRIKFTECRRRGIKRGINAGITICESERYDLFWQILNDNLMQKYDAKPVHSIDEITFLKTHFPENIKLYMAYLENSPVAGVVVYIAKQTVRAQYISTTQIGRKTGALDYLFNELINKIFIDTLFFDLGSSNGNNGHFLNENLLFSKEGFGGRGVVYETYSYSL